MRSVTTNVINKTYLRRFCFETEAIIIAIQILKKSRDLSKVFQYIIEYSNL